MPIENSSEYYGTFYGLEEKLRFAKSDITCFTSFKGEIWLFSFPPWRESYIWLIFMVFLMLAFQFLSFYQFKKGKLMSMRSD